MPRLSPVASKWAPNANGIVSWFASSTTDQAFRRTFAAGCSIRSSPPSRLATAPRLASISSDRRTPPGVGLDIVRRLLAHTDADIEVESVPGRTEFRVSLPVADANGAAGQP